MNPTDRVEIGKTGVEVTRLGLGGGPLSGMVVAEGIYGGTGYQQAVSIIRRAYELGIRYFDTAPMYGEGRSEVRYGRALADIPRPAFTVSTKVARVLDPVPGEAKPYSEDGIPKMRVSFDFSRSGILRSLEESLKRLNMQSVEILYLHDSDFTGQHPESTFREALPALAELRQQGIVKAIGMGMNQWELTARCVRDFDLDVVLMAGRYTLLDQSALPVFMAECVRRGTRVAIGGPYNSGILARDLDGSVTFDYAPAPRQLIEKARSIKAVCDRHGVDLKAAALQFVLAHPAVATAIPGAQTVAEVEQNVAAVKARTPIQLWAELKHEKLIPHDAPVP